MAHHVCYESALLLQYSCPQGTAPKHKQTIITWLGPAKTGCLHLQHGCNALTLPWLYAASLSCLGHPSFCPTTQFYLEARDQIITQELLRDCAKRLVQQSSQLNQKLQPRAQQHGCVQAAWGM